MLKSPGNDTQSSAIRCSPSRMNEGDIFIGRSFADNGNTTDTLNDDLIDKGNADTDQSGRVGRLGVDENNSTDFEKGDIDQTGTPTPPTMNSADTDKNVPPSQSKEVTAKRDCAASSTQPQNDTPESDSTTVLTQSNDPQDKATCVFVSKNYINFYRIFILFDGILQFCIPVALLIGCNTATWIKVYRTSHRPLINTTSLMIRRTRHVIILTSLISITFILYVSTLSILLVLEAEMNENIQYPLHNHKNRAVYEFIGECLFICNPTCNFFLYVISGKRFRNSLKSIFCKPGP